MSWTHLAGNDFYPLQNVDKFYGFIGFTYYNDTYWSNTKDDISYKYYFENP